MTYLYDGYRKYYYSFMSNHAYLDHQEFWSNVTNSVSVYAKHAVYRYKKEVDIPED
eukprot:CAMPEP_0170483092 /NCGR_PEP_ID=MMETSP0208-20121228/2826_1 /TAXON_ID=197538 /ORGANISM="Strombidium inclinatum, Strain S3" /LENGTH=55 /DNA_ID=CAMNT_0010756003 /DNA_START=737 /DNA_END=904 /DNA_ORIENTATION=+